MLEYAGYVCPVNSLDTIPVLNTVLADRDVFIGPEEVVLVEDE
jgi:hypothetical protein